MKRIVTAVLVLAFLAGAVGLGVHLMHKDALAATNFEIGIVWLEGVPQDGSIGSWSISTEFDGDFELSFSYFDAEGGSSYWKAVVNPDPAAGDWEINEPLSNLNWMEDGTFPIDMGAINTGGNNFNVWIHEEE